MDEGLGEFLGDILYMKGMTHLGIGEWKEADQSLAVLEEVVKALGNPPTLLALSGTASGTGRELPGRSGGSPYFHGTPQENGGRICRKEPYQLSGGLR